MFIIPIAILTLLLTKLISFINFEYILNNLDPSLFQNVFIWILMIRIFIWGILFQEGKDENKNAPFLKMVVFHQILNIKRNSIITIWWIFILAFTKDIITNNTHSIWIIIKFFMTIIIIAIIVNLLKSITKIWKFIRGSTYQEEINFLKWLNVKNKDSEKIIKARFYFWQEKTKTKEKEFTELFIEHIDKAIENYDFELAINLWKTYEDNIDKRYYVRIENLIRPKILERSEKSQTIYFSKTETNELKSQYQDSYYFQQIIFEKIIKKLLNENQEYILMEKFKEHINDLIPKITNKEKLKRYTKKIFKDFFWCLFENIREKWSYPEIPESRKINTKNLEQYTTSSWLLESYIEFFYKETFKNTEYSTKLNSITTELFPNTDWELLGELLFISKYKNNVRYLLNNSPYFWWVWKIRDPHYSINATREEKIAEMETEMETEDREDKEETYNIYIKYIRFYYNLNIKGYEQLKKYINNFKTTEELAIYRKEKLLEIIDELIKHIKENEKKINVMDSSLCSEWQQNL